MDARRRPFALAAAERRMRPQVLVEIGLRYHREPPEVLQRPNLFRRYAGRLPALPVEGNVAPRLLHLFPQKTFL